MDIPGHDLPSLRALVSSWQQATPAGLRLHRPQGDPYDFLS